MMLTANNQRKASSRGSAIIEFTFLAPWLLFLMIGVLDLGFYTYAFIATENAARIAALQTSASAGSAGSTTTACSAAFDEMQYMPNSSTMSSTCGAISTAKNGNSLNVTAAAGVDSTGAAMTTVTVTYETIQLIPIPGLLSGRFAVTRTNTQRVGS